MLSELWRPVRQSASELLLLLSLIVAVIREDTPYILGAGFMLVAEMVSIAASDIIAAIREVR